MKYFKHCKQILDFSVQYTLQHVVKISANSEMVKREPLLKLVELSWNDPVVKRESGEVRRLTGKSERGVHPKALPGKG